MAFVSRPHVPEGRHQDQPKGHRLKPQPGKEHERKTFPGTEFLPIDQFGPDWLYVQADEAAQIITKGISRNQAIIVFPTWARIYWYIYRLFPAYVDFLSRLGVRAMRKDS